MGKRQLQDSVFNRHMIAYMDSITINYIHYRKPWVVSCWSAFFLVMVILCFALQIPDCIYAYSLGIDYE